MPVVGPPMGSAQPMGYYPGPPQPSPAVYHGGPPPNMGYGPGGGGNGAPPPPQVSDHVENAKKRHDYEALCHIINQWNANRLDLFALSLPNEVGTQFFLFLRIKIMVIREGNSGLFAFQSMYVIFVF